MSCRSGSAGVAVAVAVHRKAVHHIDIDDVPVQRLHHRLSGLRHRLQKGILLPAPGAGAAGSGGVDPAFSLAGTQADGDVFDGAAEARHSVALEVGEHQVGIVLREMGPHKVFGQPAAASDRERDRAVLVQDHHIGNIGEAVILGNLVVHGGIGP